MCIKYDLMSKLGRLVNIRGACNIKRHTIYVIHSKNEWYACL